MSNIPKKANLLGMEFTIEETPIDDGEAGRSTLCFRTIHIDSSLPDDTKVETFYHEIVHVLLGLGGFDEVLGETMDEQLSQFLGVALYNLVTYNDALPIGERK